jgi:hypothetical protein
MEKAPEERFRDSIATIDESGKRNFIFPKKPKGRFYNYRTIVSWILLIILIASPFSALKLFLWKWFLEKLNT